MNKNSSDGLEEIIKVCPNNSGLLVGECGTIKDSTTGEVLEKVLSQKGYWLVKNPMKSLKNQREYEFVHRLVALTFVPGYSRFQWICHHKDKNRRNNLPENLVWSSPEMHKKLHLDDTKIEVLFAYRKKSGYAA